MKIYRYSQSIRDGAVLGGTWVTAENSEQGCVTSDF